MTTDLAGYIVALSPSEIDALIVGMAMALPEIGPEMIERMTQPRLAAEEVSS